MGTQGRDDTSTRNERNISAGASPAGGAPSEQRGTMASWTQSGTTGRGGQEQPPGWYERSRDDLRRRFERYEAGDRWDPNQREQGPMYRGSEYDSHAREAGNTERGFGYVGGYGAPHYPENRGGSAPIGPHRGMLDERNERSFRDVPARYSHDREAQAYGDYGHPGTGDRLAYGDMGVAERRGEFLRRAGTVRRWRRGGQVARDVMTRNPRTARPSDSMQVVAQIMIDEDTGIVPVIEEDNRLVGVITDRDIVCRLVARGVDLRAAKAADAMTDDVECVTEQHSLHDVLDLMSDHQVRRVPVVARGDKLVGIISMADLAREADVDEDLQDTFEDISSRRGFWARLR